MDVGENWIDVRQCAARTGRAPNAEAEARQAERGFLMAVLAVLWVNGGSAEQGHTGPSGSLAGRPQSVGSGSSGGGAQGGGVGRARAGG